ncbi:MAG: hypothetical protein K6E10_05180 [Eubacterium sp.]|nr:hypothetical protein [Eubacterium sp.]
MKAKKNMYFIVIVAAFFLVYMFSKLYIIKCSEELTKNLESIKIIVPENKSIDSSVEFLCDLSERMDIQIMYEYANQGKGFTYYTTALEESNDILSSVPESGEKRLNGFYDKNFVIELKPFDMLLEDEIYCLSGTFYIDPSKVDGLKDELNKYDIDIEIRGGLIAPAISYVKDYFFVFLIIFVQYVISVIFYVFSRTKEYIIRKSCGFNNFQNMLKEIVNNIKFYVLSFLGVIVISAGVFSFIHGIKSTLIFIFTYIQYLIIAYLVFLIILAVASCYISFICDADYLKGKTNNRNLLVTAIIIKLIILFAFAVISARTMEDTVKCNNKYKVLKESVIILEDYYRTVSYVGGLDFTNSETANIYSDSILNFYHLMDERNGAIICNFDYNVQAFGNPGFGYINDNYLDEINSVYKLNGKELSSKDLMKDKINILIPEGLDTNNLPGSGFVGEEANDLEINYIEYSPESKFFIFNTYDFNDIYVNNVIVEVVDPDLLIKYLPRDMASSDIYSFFTSSVFFKYNTERELSANDQMKDMLLESGLFPDIFHAEKADIELYECFTYIKQELYIYFSMSLLLLFTLIALCINTTLLYYQNQKKRIFVKLINGYSFMSIFKRSLLFKLMQLIFLVVLTYVVIGFLDISKSFMALSLVICFFLDYLLFCLFMKFFIKKGVKRDTYE